MRPYIVYIMAANMNRRDNKHLCVIMFLILLCIFRRAASQVSTTETSLSISTVTNISTQTPATTTTLATTTTISPQQQPTALDPNSLIGQCPCDLTGNACDVNCCCDEDCTENDKLAFSKCLPFSFDVDDRLCFRKGIFQFVNTTPANSDPFCIYFDNYKERNYYTNPSKVDTLATFQEYQNQFSGFSFMSSSLSSFDFSSTFYKNGDKIFTVFESQVIDVLGLPRSLTSADCVDKNPAAYLTDQSFSCVRRLSAPSTDCTSLAAINANNYAHGFKVVMSPQMFQVFNVSVDGAATSNLYNNSYTTPIQVGSVQCINTLGIVALCNYTTLPSPSLNTTSCNNVVQQVHYRLLTNGTRGIVSVYADFILRTLPITSTVRFSQSFKSTFQAENILTPFQRSGNPGYTVSEPVLAGTFNRTVENEITSERILLNANRDKYMTLVKPSMNGDCMTDASSDRISVVFGVNMRTGCNIRVSASNITSFCAMMHQAIINAFEFDSIPELTPSIYAPQGYVDNNRYVGLYGNSDVSKTGDWVKILNNRPLPSTPLATSSSCQLPLGMEIQILFANIGALVNAQAKIIGVSFVYDTLRTVQIRCTGPSCQSGSDLNQTVEITQSVAFIDVSKPAVGFQGEPPIFLAKVPYDFFYPFISGAVSSTTSIPLLQLLLMVSLTFIAVIPVMRFS